MVVSEELQVPLMDSLLQMSSSSFFLSFLALLPAREEGVTNKMSSPTTFSLVQTPRQWPCLFFPFHFYVGSD